jgi:hypothetical protein
MRSEYRQWLEQQGYQAGTITAQMHRAGRVEAWHGDLDEHYSTDRIASLIATLSYLKADERLARPNPSKIPFDGDIYNNLASYRNAVLRYLNFRNAGGIGVDTPPLNPGGHRNKAKLPAIELLDGVASLEAIVRRSGYVSIAAAVAEHTVFLDPKTVAQSQCRALFPAIRGERKKIITIDGRPVMLDDNAIPTDTFLWAAVRSRGKDVQFNHTWTDAKNPDLYSALWNVCATPAFLAKTTDGKNHLEVRAALQYRAYELYGTHPRGLPPVRPANYDQLRWAPMPDPVPDLKAVLHNHLVRRPLHRAAVAARTLGWLFSDWKPDTTIGG